MELWVDRYRPRTLDEYVWRDQQTRQMIESWVKLRSLPHCLFSGEPGTGKTSLALLLLNVFEIPDFDLLKINASRVRKADELGDKIIGFIDSHPMNPTGLKYILLDEADRLSQTAQGMLRGEMEQYADCCRFIMTCNYPRQIINALHSRLQEVKFATLNKTEFSMRAADVLIRERVHYDPSLLIAYVERTYPDLRKCIGVLQQNSREGKLLPPHDEIAGTTDYVLEMVNLFKQGRYRDGRLLLIESAHTDEYPSIFRTLYQNLNLFGADDQQQGRALLAIREAICNHSIVADPEINMAALLFELSMIATET